MGSTGNDNDDFGEEDFDAIFEMMIRREERLESEAKRAKEAANDANEQAPAASWGPEPPSGRCRIVVSPSLRASPSPPPAPRGPGPAVDSSDGNGGGGGSSSSNARSGGINDNNNNNSSSNPLTRSPSARTVPAEFAPRERREEGSDDGELPEGAVRSEELAEPDLEMEEELGSGLGLGGDEGEEGRGGGRGGGGRRSRSRTPPPLQGAIQESDLEEPFLPSREPASGSEVKTDLVAAEPFEVALPEQVALAFDLLDLPVTASLSDVNRKWRQWALTSHPDKVAPGEGEEHEAAARRFTALQEAKALVVSWLQGAVHVADDKLLGESDIEEEDEASDADPDACDGNLEDVDPMSKQAIGLQGNPDDWEEYLSPDGEEDIERTGDRREGSLMDAGCTALGVVDTGPGEITLADNVLEQVAALSNHMKQVESMKQYREKRCEECYTRAPLPGKNLCRQCQRDEDRMSRFLNRRP